MDIVDKYLGEAKKTEDKSDLWRYGFVETWSPPMKNWIRGDSVTIKPNKSIKAMEKEISKERGMKVRLYVPDI